MKNLVLRMAIIAIIAMQFKNQVFAQEVAQQQACKKASNWQLAREWAAGYKAALNREMSRFFKPGMNYETMYEDPRWLKERFDEEIDAREQERQVAEEQRRLAQEQKRLADERSITFDVLGKIRRGEQTTPKERRTAFFNPNLYSREFFDTNRRASKFSFENL